MLIDLPVNQFHEVLFAQHHHLQLFSLVGFGLAHVRAADQMSGRSGDGTKHVCPVLFRQLGNGLAASEFHLSAEHNLVPSQSAGLRLTGYLKLEVVHELFYCCEVLLESGSYGVGGLLTNGGDGGELLRSDEKDFIEAEHLKDFLAVDSPSPSMPNAARNLAGVTLLAFRV